MSEVPEEGESPLLASDNEEQTNKHTPIQVFQQATVYWEEGFGTDKFESRSSGRVEIYDHWVMCADPVPTWIPRDRVEYISNL